MNVNLLSGFRVLLFSGICVGHSAAQAPDAAGQIYRWTDADGRVHLSDSRPSHDADVTIVDVSRPSVSEYDPVADPYSILNQSERMLESWLEITRMRQAEAATREQGKPARAATDGPPVRRPTSWSYYIPVVGSGSDRSRAGRRQIEALEALDLLGPRSPSINSDAHRQRVEASRQLPVVATAGRPGR